ncbi:uncharacterized protein LOC125197400 isoform X2 [Salvia hispanica]|uniref:uncharacterized protein LOC125197400 isoform X2 n=1 Tax=Salvia hispanica TaxID=49212 RepID=UPI0020099775|nr:uncharacterized protein LOC125197400 isoform X2 [Salvia hispanica]
MEAQTSREPDPPPLTTRLRSRPDPFLITCRCFSVITALAAILCIAVNILSAVQSFKNGSDCRYSMGYFDATRWSLPYLWLSPRLSGNSSSSSPRSWSTGQAEGCCRSLMTRAYPEYLKDHAELFLLQSISSYLLLACGVVYIISGMCCIGMVKRARQKKEISREQAIKDLEELEQRREELESLLVPEA